jgi:hypothetical protein
VVGSEKPHIDVLVFHRRLDAIAKSQRWPQEVTVDRLTLFGLVAVSLMLVCYALEHRSRWYVLGFAGACAMGSAYGFLQGAGPSGSSKRSGHSWPCAGGGSHDPPEPPPTSSTPGFRGRDVDPAQKRPALAFFRLLSALPT